MNAKPESPEKVEHRSWRRWAIGSTIVLLLALTPIVGLHLYDASLVAEAKHLIAELDRTKPGWRTRPAKPDPLPAGADGMAVLRRAFDLMPESWPRRFPGHKLATYDRWASPYLLPKGDKESLVTMLKGAAGAADVARTLKDSPDGPFVQDPYHESELFCSWISDLLRCAAWDRMQRGEVEAAWEMCRAQVSIVRSLRDNWSRAVIAAESGNGIERVLGLGEVREEDLAAMQRALAEEARFDFVFPYLPRECADSLDLHDDMLANRVDVAEKMDMYRSLAETADTLGWWDRLYERYPRLMILKSKVEMLQRVAAVLPLRPLRGFARYEAIGRLDREFKARAPADDTQRFVWNPADMFATEQRTIALLGCAEVGLAAERFRIKFGRWPVTVNVLVDKGLLPGVPEDPYDDKPLRLRHAADGIVVHSVGATKTYDGTWYDDPTHGPGEFGNDQPPEFRLWNPDRRRQLAPSPKGKDD